MTRGGLRKPRFHFEISLFYGTNSSIKCRQTIVLIYCVFSPELRARSLHSSFYYIPWWTLHSSEIRFRGALQLQDMFFFAQVLKYTLIQNFTVDVGQIIRWLLIEENYMLSRLSSQSMSTHTLNIDMYKFTEALIGEDTPLLRISFFSWAVTNSRSENCHFLEVTFMVPLTIDIDYYDQNSDVAKVAPTSF